MPRCSLGLFYFPKERRIHTVKVLHQKPQAKIKQHLKHFVIATAALLTATTISITALAEATWGRGNGGGATSAPSPSNQLYNMTTTNELSWKIDLYVSASETGKVDPLADTIGSANLPWVGAVLYDNWFGTWEGSAGNVYVQTNYTNNRTGLTPAYITPIVYGGYTQGYKVGKL